MFLLKRNKWGGFPGWECGKEHSRQKKSSQVEAIWFNHIEYMLESVER